MVTNHFKDYWLDFFASTRWKFQKFRDLHVRIFTVSLLLSSDVVDGSLLESTQPRTSTDFLWIYAVLDITGSSKLNSIVLMLKDHVFL